MKFIKKHKSLIIALIVFILVFVLFLGIYRFFFPNEESAIYGDRLEGIKDVAVTDKDKSKIEDALKDISNSTKVRMQGRIIDVSISLKDEINRDAAKENSKKILEQLSEDQKKYFDIQVFISKEGKTEDAAQFPIIGYKHHTLDSFAWTKDR